MLIVQAAGPTHHARHDSQAPFTPCTAVPAWYTKLRPHAVWPNPTDAILRKQVGYTGPQKQAPQQGARAGVKWSINRAAVAGIMAQWLHSVPLLVTLRWVTI